MLRRFCAGVAIAALMGVCGVARAQEVAPGDGQGVIVYDQAFFASARPTTALDMIARLPGFVFDDPDNARGFNGTAGNVLINGDRPVTKTESLEAVLRRIAADGVERVELIRGGAPGIDMQGRSVLANVVLKTAARTEKVINYDAYLYPDGYVGLVPSFNISRRGGVNETELNGRLFWDRTDNTLDGLKTIAYANGAQQRALLDLHDHVYGGELRGAVQRPFFGGKARINGVVGIDDYDRSVATNVYAGPGVSDYSTERYRSWSTEAGGRFDRKVGARTDLEVVALQRFESSEYVSAARVSATEFGEDDVSGESILRGVLRTKRGEAWSLEGGLEGAYNFLDSDTRFSQAGVPIALPAASVKVEELRGEAFGTATWRPSGKLTLEAGGRLEVSRISQSGDTELTKEFVYPKPRLLLTWNPIKDNQLRFRLQREVGQLDFGDFVSSAEVDLGQVDAGNPDLEPNRSWVYELSYERRFWEKGAFNLSVRATDYDDIVDVIPVGGFDAPGNIGPGQALSAGVSLTLPLSRLHVPGGRIEARGDWVKSEVTDPTTGEKRRLSDQAGTQCNLAFVQDLPGGRWSYGAKYNCPVNVKVWRTSEVFRFYIEEQFETFVEWKRSDRLTIRLDWQNMSARSVVRSREIYAGPRSIAPVARFEARDLPFDSWVYLRVRQAF
jgi:outer membrane receptor protein involved in Fe transport